MASVMGAKSYGESSRPWRSRARKIDLILLCSDAHIFPVSHREPVHRCTATKFRGKAELQAIRCSRTFSVSRLEARIKTRGLVKRKLFADRASGFTRPRSSSGVKMFSAYAV